MNEVYKEAETACSYRNCKNEQESRLSKISVFSIAIESRIFNHFIQCYHKDVQYR